MTQLLAINYHRQLGPKSLKYSISSQFSSISSQVSPNPTGFKFIESLTIVYAYSLIKSKKYVSILVIIITFFYQVNMDWYNSDDDRLSMSSGMSSVSEQEDSFNQNSEDLHELKSGETQATQQIFQLTEEHITCQICCKYALDAVICENDKCQKLFCLICVLNTKKSLQDKCPFCRTQPFQYYSSPYSEVINKMELVCTLCKEKYTLEGEQKHFKGDCSFFHKIECCYCHQKLKKEQLVKHTRQFHPDKIDEMIMNFYLNPPSQYDQTSLLAKNKLYLQKIGKKPRLGTNGKFYCGGKLQTKCTCCNGHCGPTNGQNCVECMKLDMKRFAVPKGYLVNSSGHPCHNKGEDFVCGVMFNNQKQPCVEGNCCRACKNMKKNIKRYQHLI